MKKKKKPKQPKKPRNYHVLNAIQRASAGPMKDKKKYTRKKKHVKTE